jgi:hypothetical protein
MRLAAAACNYAKIQLAQSSETNKTTLLQRSTNLNFRNESRLAQFLWRETSHFECKVVVSAQFQGCGVKASQPQSWRFEPAYFEIKAVELAFLESSAELWQSTRLRNLNQPSHAKQRRRVTQRVLMRDARQMTLLKTRPLTCCTISASTFIDIRIEVRGAA